MKKVNRKELFTVRAKALAGERRKRTTIPILRKTKMAAEENMSQN